MGVHPNISYDKFPKQGSFPGKTVRVLFNYDTSRELLGTCVRDDMEEPFITLFQLADGRIIRATECQYAPDPDAPPAKLVIDNDQFAVVLQAFKELFPKADVVIQFDHDLNIAKNQCGYTNFDKKVVGDSILIGINPDLSVVRAVEVLAHELAHVITGDPHNHGDDWQATFLVIHERFNQIFAERHGQVKEGTYAGGIEYDF